jgi:hypothetical protein
MIEFSRLWNFLFPEWTDTSPDSADTEKGEGAELTVESDDGEVSFTDEKVTISVQNNATDNQNE